MKQIKTSSIIFVLTGIACIVKGVSSNLSSVLYLGVCLILFGIIRYVLLYKLSINANDVSSKDSDSVMRYLLMDKILYVDMIEIYKQGNCDVLYDELDGILLYDHSSHYYLASAKTKAGAQDILNMIPQDYEVFVAHDHIFKEFEHKLFEYKHMLYSFNHVYNRKEYFVLKEHNDITLKKLDMTHLDVVKEHYTIGNVFPNDYLEKRIKHGMIGAFIGDTLTGFIGIHETNAIGMLEVLPSCRKQGIATLLQCAYTNDLLKNRYKGNVYSQVNATNEASLKLQEKVYFEKANTSCLWYFNI